MMANHAGTALAAALANLLFSGLAKALAKDIPVFLHSHHQYAGPQKLPAKPDISLYGSHILPIIGQMIDV